MRNANVECLVNCQAVLGEGPVWAEAERALYWVDIKGPAIFRLDPILGAYKRWRPPFIVSSLVPRISGGFVGASERGIAWIDPALGCYELVHNPESHLPGNRSNDGKVDRAGRYWFGTMDDGERQASGHLYRIGRNLTATAVDSDYLVPNGPAFDLAGSRMYVNDSAKRLTYAFDLAADGTPSNKRVFASFGESDGYPDGMTVDAEDFLWIAFWDGWCLRRLDPEGRIERTVQMPVQRPTSCTFGGAELDRLFVTSARVGLSHAPLAGGLFAFDPGVCGVGDSAFSG